MAAGLLLLVTATACTADDPPAGPIAVQPGAPGEDGRVVTAPPGITATHSTIDVHFLHGMITHHRQALQMTELVTDRSARQDLPLLARRLEISQQDEILLMESWLQARGEPRSLDHGLMPGMLTEQQLSDLAQTDGAAFDQLFLELMIYHHEGAVRMVEELLAAGGGQEPELFQLISHIDADQRIEISRMRQLLADLG